MNHEIKDLDDINMLDWQKCNALIPCIVQDERSLQILMLGYVNQESLALSLQSKKMTFYSRSRETIWTKGETSGHFLELKKLYRDCDNDTLLAIVQAQGPTCHLETTSCFSQETDHLNFLHHLQNIIKNRHLNANDTSYTSRLFSAGLKKIAQKVGEEGVEVALAGADTHDSTLLDESADLIYHLLVLLQARGYDIFQVIKLLKQRHLKNS